MSCYQDYDSASVNYDRGRYSSGMDVQLDMLLGCLKKRVGELQVLDAGCGTGNYSKLLLDKGVGHVTMIDGSKGMLKQARKKVEPFIQTGQVSKIFQHFLPELPFEDESFDLVMFMQVLHHIDKQEDHAKRQYPNATKAIQEAFRVLRPGGILMIDMHTQLQARYGYWFYNLVPKAADNFQSRVMPEEMVFQTTKAVGFENTWYLTRPNSCLIRMKEYCRTDGPLFKEWRDLDSIWGVVQEEELNEALNFVKKMKDTGKLEAYFQEKDKVRQHVGQSITVFSKKSASVVNGSQFSNGFHH